MGNRSQFFNELFIIMAAFGFIFFNTLIFYVVSKLYRTFNNRFGKRIARDVEKESLESWRNKDS